MIHVRTKNEVGGPALTWTHNLFVVWALDFLVWVFPNTETQQSNLFLRIPLLSYYYSFVALSLPLFLVSYGTIQKKNLFSSLASHIYSPKLMEEL